MHPKCHACPEYVVKIKTLNYCVSITHVHTRTCTHTHTHTRQHSVHPTPSHSSSLMLGSVAMSWGQPSVQYQKEQCLAVTRPCTHHLAPSHEFRSTVSNNNWTVECVQYHTELPYSVRNHHASQRIRKKKENLNMWYNNIYGTTIILFNFSRICKRLDTTNMSRELIGCFYNKWGCKYVLLIIICLQAVDLHKWATMRKDQSNNVHIGHNSMKWYRYTCIGLQKWCRLPRVYTT